MPPRARSVVRDASPASAELWPQPSALLTGRLPPPDGDLSPFAPIRSSVSLPCRLASPARRSSKPSGCTSGCSTYGWLTSSSQRPSAELWIWRQSPIAGCWTSSLPFCGPPGAPSASWILRPSYCGSLLLAYCPPISIEKPTSNPAVAAYGSANAEGAKESPIPAQKFSLPRPAYLGTCRNIGDSRSRVVSCC